MEAKYLHSNKELKKRSHILKFDKEYDFSLNGVKTKFNENPDCTAIFIAIVGSTSYGMDLEGSDLDMKGVYIQNLDSILSDVKLGQANTHLYKPQLGGAEKGNKEKKKEDITLYELGRYFELIQTNNPNILELLNTPEDCIVYEHPLWKDIKAILSEDKVLTKKCYFTFHNYAIQQIKKAKGLNKKINKPISKERKSPLDFTYAIVGYKSLPLKKWLELKGYDQKFCGLVNIDKARDTYALFYDKSAHSIFMEKNNVIKGLKKLWKRLFNKPMGFGYKGILNNAKDDFVIYNSDKTTETVPNYSSSIRTSSIPKGEKEVVIISYDKDAYSTYTKAYNEFWGNNGWIHLRNEERYNDNTKSGQDYDGKNMSHCLRLLFMAEEIALGKGIQTMRNSDHRELLIDIKKGKLEYEEIMDKANKIIYGYNPDNAPQNYDDIQDEMNAHTSLEELYKDSNLPEEVDLEYIQKSLLKIRKEFYGI
jgi:predicted nucleotidyltransferase